MVSHDRAFMDAVADHLFVFEGDGDVRNFEGSFSEFLDFDRERRKGSKTLSRGSKNLEREAEAKAPPVEEAVKPAPRAELMTKAKKPALKLSFKDKRDYENLEKEIQALMKKKTDLEAKLLKGDDAP